MNDKNAARAPQNQVPRPPIIVVMGHVDHGKTTLLDYIRKTSVAAKEAGGITQSIGAYEITHNGKKITFIDTPGHEAFSKMRSRGANVADLAILVVAADDGVQKQTQESIMTLKKTETPFVVAINKIDKPNVQVDKIKNELAQNDVLLEGYGGNISWQNISAKTGQGVSELLDLLLLAAELEDLKYNPRDSAKGVVIEAKMDPKRGLTAVLIVKNGALKRGDFIKTASASGKVKILENFLGKPEKELLPSSPAIVIGWDSLPTIGEEFETQKTRAEMPSPTADKKIGAARTQAMDAKNIRIIMKTDVSGSLEALAEIVSKIKTDGQKIEIVDRSIGDISENDVKTASSMDAIIVGFRVSANKDAENLAMNKNVKIISGDIIYELAEKLEEELKQSQKPIRGDLQVLAVFDQKSPARQIVGGKVLAGAITRNEPLNITRNNKNIGVGKIINLQQNRKDAQEVGAGKECGILLESETLVKVGDRLTVS